MSCKFCGKVFNRSFNLRRHERENCTLKDRRSQEMDFEDNFSTSSIDSESESLMATDNEGESEEQLDPWVPLIEEAKRRSDIVLENVKEILINSGIDEQTARDQAYSNVLPKLQKELESVYMQRLMWMAQLKNDPIHRKIMQTKNALMKNDDFDPEEAMEAAIDKRKFLIRRLLKDYSFTKENDDAVD